MSQLFDVAVIGAGPGGYVAAIRAAQLGLSTICIDDWKNAKGRPSLGGTCLNVGCIPSKALLESSENFERAAQKFADHGIRMQGLSMDIAIMQERKDKIVSTLTSGITMLFKKNKVNTLHGRGRLVSVGATCGIQVSDGANSEAIEARHVIIATGSLPRQLPMAQVDNELILDNEGALALTEVPRKLGVVGAGVIGLEMGSVWRRLGAEVTVLEALPAFLGALDGQVAKEAFRIFSKELGLIIHTGVTIESVTKGKGKVSVKYADKDGTHKADFDKLIVAIGRVPNSASVGPDAVGMKVDAHGFIEVDEFCRTNLPNVFAIGDVVRGPMLAHKSSEEGAAVAEFIAGQKSHVNLETVPWVIYTSPEIAWVGRNEQQLKEDGVAYRSGMFPFTANGRARSLGETDGFIKILADAATDRILGVHIIGPFASELIAEATIAMEFGASAEDIARSVHAHPSLSEVMHEAALSVDERSLHI
jgi:dihydrolipoamide dehydrogenase